MVGALPSISIRQLVEHIGIPVAPILLDVRSREDFAADTVMIAGARRCEPETVEQWASARLPERPVVVYCEHGLEISREAARKLVARDFDARFLDGGIAAWKKSGAVTLRKDEKTGIGGSRPSRWVTRERPTIDRIACPWLIRRFIDPEGEFLYVPADKVAESARQAGATPYDVANVAFGHHGDECSFDAFIHAFGIAHPALRRLADIVRGADTSRPDLTPQSAGLLAISQGLKVNFTDDHAMLAEGMIIYDALYAWCRQQAKAAA
jgi:rhodanese-related sulfurtransferase